MFKLKPLLISFLAVCLTACVSDGEYSVISNDTYSRLTVSANASAEDLTFPVVISAYDDDGNRATQQELTSITTPATLSLQKGSYTITASSGNKDFSKGYTTSDPLAMGVKSIEINGNTNLELKMAYRVAKVNVTLSDIEQDVTDVSITINSLYSSINELGELGGNISPTIPCTKDADGKWKTGTFYTLPGTGSNTQLIVTKHFAEGTKQYTVTIDEPLKAGNIYNLNGRYDDTHATYKLQVSLTFEGWQETVSKDFSFDDNGGTVTEPGESSGGNDSPSTSDAPSEASIWNGHVVALVDGNTIILISKKEWNITDASSIPTDEISAYSEDSYTGWTIPTEAQGKAIASRYCTAGYKINDINNVLDANSLTKLNDGKGDIRYLCADGTSAFSFAYYNSTVGTSNKSYDYRMRLVKTITITAKE